MQHTTAFQQHNLPQLWIRAGVGATIRFVYLRKLFKPVGNQQCAVLTAVHIITGYQKWSWHQESNIECTT